MDRAERVGLGVAVVGHVLLFGILSLGLVTRAKLPPLKNEPIDVVLVDAIGLRSAAPEATPEPPAPSEAPAVAKPAEAVAPTPAPPEPEPAPEPAPAPKPKPPKPAPPKPEPPKPTPAPPKPVPAPKPTPAPKPVVKPAPAKVEPKPAKPAPAKPTPAKPAPADQDTDSRDRRRPDRPTEAGGGVPATKPAKPAGGKPGDKPAKAAGSRLGPDFLKGITPEKGPGKAIKPAAAAVSAQAIASLGSAIARQVKPCYELGSLGGTPAMSIVTTLRMRMNRDGTVASVAVIEQSGVNAGNQTYARQMGELSRRAVLRCAPLKLPAELYEGGWEDIAPVFTPGQME